MDWGRISSILVLLVSHENLACLLSCYWNFPTQHQWLLCRAHIRETRVIFQPENAFCQAGVSGCLFVSARWIAPSLKKAIRFLCLFCSCSPLCGMSSPWLTHTHRKWNKNCMERNVSKVGRATEVVLSNQCWLCEHWEGTKAWCYHLTSRLGLTYS